MVVNVTDSVWVPYCSFAIHNWYKMSLSFFKIYSVSAEACDLQ